MNKYVRNSKRKEDDDIESFHSSEDLRKKKKNVGPATNGVKPRVDISGRKENVLVKQICKFGMKVNSPSNDDNHDNEIPLTDMSKKSSKFV
jgi:hypothetical protein